MPQPTEPPGRNQPGATRPEHRHSRLRQLPTWADEVFGTGNAGQVVRHVLLRRNIAVDPETAQLVAAAVQAVLQAGTPSAPPRQGPRSSRPMRATVLSLPSPDISRTTYVRRAGRWPGAVADAIWVTRLRIPDRTRRGFPACRPWRS